MPAHRPGSNGDAEPPERAGLDGTASAESTPSARAPTTPMFARAGTTADASPVVGATLPVVPGTLPVVPGTLPVVPMAALLTPSHEMAVLGHLEDPEWTRALLGLADAVVASAGHPLAWTLESAGFAAFLEATDEPPSPFRAHNSGVGWFLPRDPRLVEPISPSSVVRASTRAGLITLWQDEKGRCLLDTVAAGTVALDGPPVAVGYTLSDIVVELASRRWSDLQNVLLVGFGREMHGLENVRYLPTVEDAVGLLMSADRSGEQGARCFVIAPMPVDEVRRSALARFLRLVEQTPFSGAICCDTAVRPRCTWHLASHGQTLRFEVSGRAGPSAVLSPARWVERSETALRVTRGPAQVAAVHAPHRAEQAAPVAVVTPDSGFSPGVEVRVLGPVQVVGTAESLEGRPLLKELVVYLAFHGRGVTGETCASALWPDRRVPSQTLSNRLHEARRALGSTPDGRPRLMRTEGRHLLASDVRTDWDRFVGLTSAGSGPASWRQALMLVRGQPFAGLARGDWTVFEGLQAAVETAVVSVSARLAEHSLEAGDPLGAEWAIQRGLMVTPWDEGLYRLLMTAADAAGNRGGVESALRSLAQVLDWSGDPIDVVHPETAALYRQLTGKSGHQESPKHPTAPH
jgi:DNA-binding SARP family transcriptional activator